MRAEQYLAAALREGHDPEQVLPVLMRVCLSGSRLRAALNHASPYLKQQPDAVWLRYLVANVHLGLRQPMRAREHLLMIEARAPGHAPAQYLLGLTEWESFGDQGAAARHFERYLQLEPDGQHAAEVRDWLRARSLRAGARSTAEAQAAAVAAAPVRSPAVVTPAAVAPAAATPAAVAPAAVTPAAVTPAAVTPGEVEPGALPAVAPSEGAASAPDMRKPAP